MQLITAIIQPFMVDRLTRALRKAGFKHYTVDEAQGSSLVPNDPVHLQGRIRIEVAVVDERSEELMELIGNTVSTHQQGDGVIYAMPITRFVHIQSGLIDNKALTQS
jgi:nitrogen regulatory protein PII